MTKAEIISKTLQDMRRIGYEKGPLFNGMQDEEQFIVSILQDVLLQADIKTCDDFKHLGVECCAICHEGAAYEMSVIDLPDGEKAWLCDALETAIYPKIQPEIRHGEQMLNFIFGLEELPPLFE